MLTKQNLFREVPSDDSVSKQNDDGSKTDDDDDDDCDDYNHKHSVLVGSLFRSLCKKKYRNRSCLELNSHSHSQTLAE